MYELVAGFLRCLVDRREPGKLRHTLADLLGRRIFGIACGHPDGNDVEHLADDSIHNLLLGRDPVAGAPLASQPTISRFDNGATRTALYRMGRELATPSSNAMLGGSMAERVRAPRSGPPARSRSARRTR